MGKTTHTEASGIALLEFFVAKSAKGILSTHATITTSQRFTLYTVGKVGLYARHDCGILMHLDLVAVPDLGMPVDRTTECFSDDILFEHAMLHKFVTIRLLRSSVERFADEFDRQIIIRFQVQYDLLKDL